MMFRRSLSWQSCVCAEFSRSSNISRLFCDRLPEQLTKSPAPDYYTGNRFSASFSKIIFRLIVKLPPNAIARISPEDDVASTAGVGGGGSCCLPSLQLNCKKVCLNQLVSKIHYVNGPSFLFCLKPLLWYSFPLFAWSDFAGVEHSVTTREVVQCCWKSSGQPASWPSLLRCFSFSFFWNRLRSCFLATDFFLYACSRSKHTSSTAREKTATAHGK